MLLLLLSLVRLCFINMLTKFVGTGSVHTRFLQLDYLVSHLNVSVSLLRRTSGSGNLLIYGFKCEVEMHAI